MKGQHRRSDETRTGKSRAGFSLLMMQGLVCGVVLLLALMLRLIGGEAWTQLHELFRQWITDDGLAQAITEQLVPDTGDSDEATSDHSAVTVSSVSAGAADELSAELLSYGTAPLTGGWVTSLFGYREDPIHGGTGFHSGVDIAAKEGTPLYAICDGCVTASEWNTEYGYYITLRCVDGFEITYAHCSELLCGVGETVKAGQTVAKVGSTGASTGPHLHLMLYKDGAYRDPQTLLPEAWYA